MQHITNKAFTKSEITLIEFVLQHADFDIAVIIEQLNKLNEYEIIRDFSQHHWIIEFRTGGVRSGYIGMTKIVSFQVLHDNNSASTVFNLYKKDGHIFECEIFNTDSSEMDMNNLMNGQIHKTL